LKYERRYGPSEGDGAGESPHPQPLWEKIVALGQSLPPEVRERLPRDLAAEHDHYLYGSPKIDA